MVNIGMNRYENLKIYKITDTGYNKVYVGSTCESLSKRIERHRAKYSSYKTGKTNKNLSVFEIFDEFGIEDCKIELIENYPCSCKEELLRREGHYIKALIVSIRSFHIGRKKRERRLRGNTTTKIKKRY